MHSSMSTSVRRASRWLATGLLLVLTACGGSGGEAKQQPGTTRELLSISVAPTTATIETGGTQQFTARAHYNDGTTAELASGVTWSSTQPAIATVDAATGLATGVATATGSTVITATQGGLSGTATLTVTPKALVVQSVSIAPATVSLAAGRTLSLNATAHMSDGTAAGLTSGVTWSASPSSVASVSAAGVLTAIAAGDALVTVTHVATGLTATRQVTVTSAVLESITVAPGSTSVVVGLSRQLTATGHYSDGTSALLGDTEVTWSSTAPAVASVSATGLATGVTPGATVIRATHAASSSISGSASLTVQAVAMNAIAIASVDPVPAGLDAQLAVTASFTNGTSQPVASGLRFESSDPSVALVNGDGVVFALAPGQATIKVTHVASGLSSSSVFTVSAARLERISLPDPIDVPAGFSRALAAVGHFSDGSSGVLNIGVTWGCSAASVARVDEAGVLTAVAAGTASVTATAPGGISVNAQVIVSDATIVSLRIEPNGGFLRQGENLTVTPVALFSDGLELALSPHSVVWTSSDANVASVADGVVLGIGGGAAMITAQHVASGRQVGEWFYVSPVFDLAYAGGVLSAAGSAGPRGTVYRVHGVTPGSWYTVTIADATTGVQLWVDGGAIACGASAEAGGVAGCAAPAAGNELLVEVTSSSSLDAQFTLSVEPAAAPGFTPFTVGAPVSGTLTGGGEGALYELIGLAPGYYLITLDGLTGDADLAVYADAGGGRYLCGSWLLGTRAETCAVYAPLGGSLFVGISEPVGASAFTLSARAIAAPVPVLVSELPRSIHVDGYAVFAVGAVIPGAAYDVVLEGGATADVDLRVLAEADLVDELCQSRTAGAGVVEQCVAQPTGTRLYVAVDATHEASGADVTVRVNVRP